LRAACEAFHFLPSQIFGPMLLRMFNAIDTFLGAPDCAHYFIFAGYLAFMWGIVGTANYFDAANADL
jgi:hypothetical protein